MSKPDATIVISGIHRWDFDAGTRTWTAKGLPGLRIKATILKGPGGRQHPAWILDPSGEPFRGYMEAMLAAEEQFGSHRVSARSTRTTRRTR